MTPTRRDRGRHGLVAALRPRLENLKAQGVSEDEIQARVPGRGWNPEENCDRMERQEVLEFLDLAITEVVTPRSQQLEKMGMVFYEPLCV